MIDKINNKEKKSAVFYFHPWEIDPDQPIIEGIDGVSKFRHYVNLHKTEKKLERLLQDFKWNRMDKIFLGI